MKRMDHVLRGPEGPDERGTSRRGFFKVAGAALLGGALAVSPMSFFGREAKATTPVTINGQKVYKLTLSDTINNLDKKSKPYASNGAVASVLNVPKEGLHVSIGLGRKDDGSSTINFRYSKSATDTTQVYAGFDLRSFVDLVKQVSGQEPKSARLFFEFDSAQNGERVINVYAIPLDANGKVIGQYKGGQLAYGASYYSKKRQVFGAKAILYDPKPKVGAVASTEY
ncbi:MAG: hypothetical protein AB1295_01040 [Candidatus Micrarchaeota archaeon]